MDSLSQINHRRLRNYFQSHWNSTEESKSKVKQTEYRAEVIFNSTEEILQDTSSRSIPEISTFHHAHCLLQQNKELFFKAALLNNNIFTMVELTTYNMKGVARSDEPTYYHPNMQSSSTLACNVTVLIHSHNSDQCC